MKVKAKKNIKIAFISLLISIMSFTLIGCSGNLSKKVVKSLKSVKTATVMVAVKDGETEVYCLNKTMSFIDGGANVATTTKKLNPNSFGFKEETLNEFVENATAKDSILLNLNKKIFESIDKDGDVTTVKVLKSKANEFFGVADAKANSDVVARFVFEKKKLKSISLSYTLVSGRTVELTATYTY